MASQISTSCHRFVATPTPIAGLTLLRRLRIGDQRGYFERMFCHSELEPWLGGHPIAQVNHTFTGKPGTLRGLHHQQPPHAETKFIQCLRGRVFDVVVDLRPNSQTFLHWHAEILSADHPTTLVVGAGLAHGFQTLCGDCEMLYLHTTAHCPGAEAGVHPLDPSLRIPWPLGVSEMSARDAAFPLLEPPAINTHRCANAVSNA